MFVVSNFRFYLDNKLVIGDPSTQIKDSSLEFLALELRFFGGTVSDSLDEKVSHVMVDKRSEPKFNSKNFKSILYYHTPFPHHSQK